MFKSFFGKTRFTWADYFALWSIYSLHLSAIPYVVILIIWFTLSAYLTNKYYHEPLPRN